MKCLVNIKFISILILPIALFACAPQKAPYSADVDVKKEIETALASLDGKHLLVVFGANWCPDCWVLDERMNSSPLRELVNENLRVVKVDIGEGDLNMDVVSWFGDPISKGIPSIAIANAKREILFQTTGGELATVRSQPENSTYEYFNEIIKAINTTN